MSTPDSTPSHLGGPRAAWTMALVVSAVVALAFAPALHGALLGDDLASFADAGTVDATAPPGNSAWTAHPLERAVIAGTRLVAHGSPLALHAVSLGIHLAATAALFFVVRRWTQRNRVALCAAVLFGLHPVQVASVARISALHAPLAGLCVLLALGTIISSERRTSTSWVRALVSTAFFVCGLAASTSALALIPIVASIDLAAARAEPSRRTPRAPYVAYAIAALLWFVARSAALASPAFLLGVDAPRLVSLRVEMFGHALRDLAWPFDPALFHPFRPEIAWSDPSLVIGACGGVALIAACVWLYRTRRALACAALLWIPATLAVPLVTAHTAGMFPIAAEDLYLSVAGCAILVALAGSTTVGCAALAALACAFGVRAHARTHLWSDDRALLEAAVAETPRNPTLRWRLGRAQLVAYTESGDRKALTAAGRTFQSALDLLSDAQRGDHSIFATSDDFLQSNLGLGWSLLFEAESDPYGKDDTAQRVFEKVVARYPSSAEAHTGLGVSALALGRLDESEHAFETALKLRPGYPEALHDLGQLRVRRGDWNGAARAFEEALHARPDSLEDLLCLARAYVEGGDSERALALIARASTIAPRHPAPHVLRGTIDARRGALDTALEWADRALAVAPDDGEALLLRGRILLARGELFGARRAIERAADRLPRSYEAHYNLAALMLKSGERAEALPHLVQAYALRPAGESSGDLHRTLVDIGIQDAETCWRLATIDTDRGLGSGAEEWLARALTLDPEHGPSHLSLGLLRKERGDTAGAVSALEHACRSMPQSYPAHFTLGMLLADTGRAKEGLHYLERALEQVTKEEGADPASAAALQGLRQKVEEVRALAH